MTDRDAWMRDAALDYCRRGWSVVALRPRGKYPLIRWEPFQYRPAEAAEVRRWYDRWPDANVGIVTGQVSGLVVLDVDPRHGGEDSVAEWAKRDRRLPESVEAETGGGGRHLYLLAPRRLLRNRVGLAPGIDLRANGGLIVAPPSVHPSGRRYAWRADRAPADRTLAPVPDWLIRMAAGDGDHGGHSIRHWRKVVEEGVVEGVRNNTIASLAGHLLWHGVDPQVTLELLLCWNRARCRPPLDDEEVAGVVASIRKLHEARDQRETEH